MLPRIAFSNLHAHPFLRFPQHFSLVMMIYMIIFLFSFSVGMIDFRVLQASIVEIAFLSQNTGTVTSSEDTHHVSAGHFFCLFTTAQTFITSWWWVAHAPFQSSLLKRSNGMSLEVWTSHNSCTDWEANMLWLWVHIVCRKKVLSVSDVLKPFLTTSTHWLR